VAVYLETERLVLRELDPGDLDDLVALDSDPAVMHYVTGGRPTSREEMRDDILPFWLGFHERGEPFGFFAAIERATGSFLGWFHLRPRTGHSPRDGVELGFRLHRWAWGRGYATEASRALIRKAFTELGVERVYAETMAVNVASRRVMEKAGLRYVRTFHADWPDRIPGDEHGDVEYAITRGEWLEARGEGDT
jgi:RimJ/RimL family protein N-acetyltransferase